MSKILSVIVPVYKEEKSISPFLERINNVLGALVKNGGIDDYEIIFCLDPSPDDTAGVISNASMKDPRIKMLTMSRRFGQVGSTMAGILTCGGDACVTIDVDLQDPPELITDFVAQWNGGCDVVYARRKSRQGETILRKVTDYLGYWLINKISEVNIARNTGDYRLISRKVIEHLRKLKETDGFLKGLVPAIGFKQAFVEYDRDARYSGKSNYNRFIGNLTLSFNGVFCFSSVPLHLVTWLGTISMFVFAILFVLFLIQEIAGIALHISMTILLISLYGGLSLFCGGIRGEYISRIYNDVKQRPMFIIADVLDNTGSLQERAAANV